MSEIKERDIQEMDEAAKSLEEDQDYKYIAFISYRHLEPDISVAKKVHTMIETFKLPSEFYEGRKRPVFRVFRDREELTTSSLSESIQDALRQSKHLIVICSKRLRESEWCNIEVETFIQLHGVDRVIPVLIEGEPEDSFPKALISDFEDTDLEDGSVEVKNHDILAAELRSEEVLDPSFVGFKTLEQTDPNKVRMLAKKATDLLKNEKYRIMAAILGVSFGDLKQRDKARRQRVVLGISAVVSVALLIFGIFMYNAYRNENIAKRQTIQDRSAFMLDESENLLREGSRYEALHLSEQAISDLDDEMEQFEALRNRHRYILQNALLAQVSSYNRVIDTGNQFTFLDIREKDQSFALGLGNDSLGIFDLKTGNLLHRAAAHTQQVKLVSYSSDEAHILSGGFDDRVVLWDAPTLEVLAEVITPGNIMFLQFNGDDAYVEVIYDTIDSYVYQRYDAKTLEPKGSTLILDPGIVRVSFSADGNSLWVIYNTYQENASLKHYDLTTSTVTPVLDRTVETLEGESFLTPYKDLVSSKDQKDLYTMSSGALQKRDYKTGDILWENTVFGGIGESFILLDGGEFIYVVDGISLLKINSESGVIETSIRTGSHSMVDGLISEDGSRIMLLDETGMLWIITEDQVVDIIRNTDDSNPEYLYWNEAGNQAISLSLSDKQVKLVSVLPETSIEFRKGQIAGTSASGDFLLLYDDGIFNLVDATNMETLRAVDHDFLPKDLLMLTDNIRYRLSDDGALMAGIHRELDAEGNVLRTELFVLDTETSEIKLQTPVPGGSFNLGFSPDGRFLFYDENYEQVRFLDVESGEDHQVMVDRGFISSMLLTADNEYLLVNYTEGHCSVYNRTTGEKIHSVPGSGLSLEKKEESLLMTTLYNNLLTHYQDFEVIKETTLSPIRDELGDQIGDTNLYSSTHEQLLTIRSRGDRHVVYLLDAKTGMLLSTYELTNFAFTPRGLLSSNGSSFLLDYIYGSEMRSGDDYVPHASLGRFPIGDYPTLHEQAEEVMKGVEIEGDQDEDQ